MKNVPCLVASLLLSTGFIAAVAADGDPSSQVPTTSEILSLQDPDGVPFVISHPQEKALSQDEIEANKKEAQQEADNKDWLLRSYEEQLRKRTGDQSSGESDNLYYRIATDKSLSKLAGVSSMAPAKDESSSASRTSDSPLGIRPDSPLTPGINPSSTGTPLFKPLITPLGSADAAGLHNFYSIQPTTAPAAAAPAPKTDTTRISADLDMPGQVGAERDPLTKDSLTFDTVPNDALPDKGSTRAHVADDILPLSTNAAQIQKLNDAALTAPGSIKTVTPLSGSSLNLKYQEDPAPAKLPAPSPVRQAIANPYSILDR